MAKLKPYQVFDIKNSEEITGNELSGFVLKFCFTTFPLEFSFVLIFIHFPKLDLQSDRGREVSGMLQNDIVSVLWAIHRHHNSLSEAGVHNKKLDTIKVRNQIKILAQLHIFDISFK